MSSRWSAWVAAAVGFCIAGCPAPKGKCDGVKCSPGQVCDPGSGQCVEPFDGGSDAGFACVPPCVGQTPVCDSRVGQCKVCTTTQGCAGPTPTCDTTQGNGLGACVVCTAGAGCAGTTPVCDTSVQAGQCVQCLTSGDCSGASPICNPVSKVCVSLDGGVVNDDCSGALAITFNDAGVGAFAGDTTHATNSNQLTDQSPSCSTSARQSGNDMVYRFTLSAAQDVTIVVTPTGPDGGTLQPVVYVRKPGKCASGSAADEVSCDSPDQVAPSTTANLNQPPGTYALWIDGSADSNGNPTAGPFTGTVTIGPPTLPPANDDCSGAVALAFDGGAATVSGSTRGATNSNAPSDQSPTCSPSALSTGADVVYSYTLTAPQDVTIVVSPAGPSALQPVVYVRARNACASGNADDELSCDNPSVLGQSTSTTRLVNQQPGTYFLWVDGALGTIGDFSLTLTLASPSPEPPNDTCATAAPLTFPVSGLSGTTWAAQNNLTDLCGGPLAVSAGEVVYTFAASNPGQLTATVTPVVSDAGTLFPYLYLRDAMDCAQTTGQGSLGCNVAPAAGDPATLVAQVDAGTYFLVVDSFRVRNGPSDSAPSGGPFTLDATFDPVPAVASNVDCASAAPLSFSNGSAVSSANTGGVAVSGSLSCAPGAAALAWQLTTPPLDAGVAAYSVRAMASSENADLFAPAVSLQTTCADAGPDVDCEVGANAPYVAVAQALRLGANTPFYAWVAGADAGSQGPFSLEVDVAPVPAPNDACGSGVVTLTANTSVAGTTLGAADDLDNASAWYTASGSGTGCIDTFPGADVVYSYTATASGPVTVTVQPQPGFDLGIGVIAPCAPNNCIGTRDVNGDGIAESITFQAVADTTYSIVVDSFVPDVAPGDPSYQPDGRGGFIIGVSQ